jgi:hypothetical protein
MPDAKAGEREGGHGSKQGANQCRDTCHNDGIQQIDMKLLNDKNIVKVNECQRISRKLGVVATSFLSSWKAEEICQRKGQTDHNTISTAPIRRSTSRTVPARN